MSCRVNCLDCGCEVLWHDNLTDPPFADHVSGGVDCLRNQLAQRDAIIAEYEDEALLTGYLDKIEAKDAEIERLKQYIDEALDKISPGWADAVKEPKP